VHIVYKITFKTTGKSYIGYTSKGILERIHKHMTNAAAGCNTHFYKALRLYGLGDCVFETIFESDNKNEAIAYEKVAIKKFNTIENGYNSMDGGSGGFIVPDSKYEQWKNGLSRKAKGNNNPNYSGVSNEAIIEKAVTFYVDNGNRLIPQRWKEYSKLNGLPQTYSKHRWGGGMSGFIKELKNKLDELSILHGEFSFKLKKEERYAKDYKK
jgi:hypothetical protein